jgi:hypothetical protein
MCGRSVGGNGYEACAKGRWRNVFACYGVGDELACVASDARGRWGDFRFWRNSDDAPVAVEVVADALADHERVGIEQQRAPAIEADRGLQDLDRLAAQSVDIRARVRQVVDALTTALTLPLTRHAITVPRERGRATSQPCGVAGAKIPAFWDWSPHSAPAGSW